MRNFLAGGGAPPAATERGAEEAAEKRLQRGFRPPSGSGDRPGPGRAGTGSGGAGAGEQRPALDGLCRVRLGPAAPPLMAAHGLRLPRLARAGAALLPLLLLLPVLSRGAAQELSPRGRNVCRAGG